MQDLIFASATELTAAIRAREVSAVEVLDAHLAQIARHNPALNAVVTLDAAAARARAVAADAALVRGENWGPLHGLPLTLKDCHSTAGLRTTAGYPPLASYVPAEDGTVAARLRAAGAIILGKTNVSTLLMDIQAGNPVFGRTNNPWDLARTAGGSSGGAAAALAAGLTPLEIGSDFAGSIRLPAHFCGVYGLKPTAGRVSLAGHIPDLPGAPRSNRVLWSVGPLARSVADLALAFRVIAGADPRDPDVPPLDNLWNSALPLDNLWDKALPLDALWDRAQPLDGLRLAWAPTFPGVPVAAAVRTAVANLAAVLAQHGAQVEERLPPISFEEQAQVRTQLAKMTQAAFAEPAVEPPPTLAGYFRLLDRRDALIAAWEDFFGAWDALLCPVAMIPAFPHCPAGTPLLVDGTPERYWRIIGHCAPFNLTGHPVVVIPAGQDPAGLPIGVQIVGRRWAEGHLLAVAAAVDAVAGGVRRPSLGSQ